MEEGKHRAGSEGGILEPRTQDSSIPHLLPDFPPPASTASGSPRAGFPARTTKLSGAARESASRTETRAPSAGRRRLPRRSSALSHLPAGVGASPGPPPRRSRGLRPAGRPSRGPAPCPRVPAAPPAVRSPPGPRPLPCCPAQPPSTPDPEVPSPPAPGLPALKAQAPFVWTPPPPPRTPGRVAGSPSKERGRGGGDRRMEPLPPRAPSSPPAAPSPSLGKTSGYCSGIKTPGRSGPSSPLPLLSTPGLRSPAFSSHPHPRGPQRRRANPPSSSDYHPPPAQHTEGRLPSWRGPLS